ncbi:phage major capsid protein [Rhodococcus sp. IEGM 1409]|uniref:phage major capsid protein n=1 Tax=Rhodococcus sp. IEGM 1409 TaxID=3047082 RepID=UPI0024B84CAD|nr:phage major capsid protein [Rhodococcus sp. IEGM 1409]MDI9900545.1 phage major capsid protein [Rhodococcus sp. IEGM 1409]
MASSIRIARLKGEAEAAVKSMKLIATKADEEARDLTEDEQAEFDKYKTQAEELVKNLEAARHDVEVISAAETLAKQVGTEPVEEPTSDDTTKAKAQSLGLQVVGSAQFKSAMAPYKGAGQVPERSRFQTDPIGIKGLFVGASPTSGGAFVTPEQTGIVEMLGRKELTIRNLVSVRRTGSDTVEYVAQTAHTNAAAVVPEATSSAAPTAPASGGGALIPNAGGGYKPEGSWAFERKTAVVKTIAEWVPATKRALADVAALEGLINDELRADITEKEEQQILNGTGAGEDLTGINATSGIQTQAFVDDLFTSVRKAITKVRTIGRVAPTAIVVSPEDAELIDLAKDGENRYYYGGPFAFGNRTLWGVPVVESESQPSGTATLGDYSKAVLWDREQTTVTVTDSHADFFIRNMIAILAEERVAFAVTRPSAFVKVATHA